MNLDYAVSTALANALRNNLTHQIHESYLIVPPLAKVSIWCYLRADLSEVHECIRKKTVCEVPFREETGVTG